MFCKQSSLKVFESPWAIFERNETAATRLQNRLKVRSKAKNVLNIFLTLSPAFKESTDGIDPLQMWNITDPLQLRVFILAFDMMVVIFWLSRESSSCFPSGRSNEFRMSTQWPSYYQLLLFQTGQNVMVVFWKPGIHPIGITVVRRLATNRPSLLVAVYCPHFCVLSLLGCHFLSLVRESSSGFPSGRSLEFRMLLQASSWSVTAPLIFAKLARLSWLYS